jgi:trehalose/maltose transport system permease protein
MAAPTEPLRRTGSLASRRARSAWLMVAPALLIIALTAGYPLLQTFRYAFTNASFLRPGEDKFVGFTNFTYLLGNADWWTSVRNTVIFSGWSVILEFALGLALALIINSNFRGRGLMRAAILVPWAIPTAVSSQMWKYMYNDVFGVINDLLLRLRLINQPVAWIANPDTTLGAIIAVDVWKTTPFVALLLLAGLQTIPSDIYEAAKVDGASTIRQFFRITLPLLTPAILVTLIFRTLDALRVFDVIQIMTGTNRATMSMSIYNRQHLIDFSNLGFGSAVSVMIFLIIGVFTVIYLTTSRVKFD